MSSLSIKRCCTCKEKKLLDLFSKNRTTKDGLQTRCKVCQSESAAKWRSDNPEYGARYRAENANMLFEYGVRYRAENVDKRREYDVKYYIENVDKRREYGIKYRAENVDKERERCLKWVRENPDKHNATAARRRSRKLQATPFWAEHDMINVLYEKAKIFNSHVDHIVPLKSDIVCGLHCWHNLQLLPAEINLSKNNRFWPDMP